MGQEHNNLDNLKIVSCDRGIDLAQNLEDFDLEGDDLEIVVETHNVYS